MRQYTDSFNSLVSLWYKPGSTVVARGFVVTNTERTGIVHRSSQCLQVWPFDLRTETIFNHPTIGDYTLTADGVRTKFVGWCNACAVPRTPCHCGRPETNYKGVPTGLCRNHHKTVIRASRARVRSSALSVNATTNE